MQMGLGWRFLQFGGRTGLYAVGLPIKEATRKGYKMAYEGDSVDISYYSTNTRRGRVGHKIAHSGAV